MHLKARKSGFTFIEMLVALAINVVLLAALATVFSNNIGHYSKVVNIDTLNQQLQIAMQIMQQEIRRAGFWANVQSAIGTHVNSNPFQSAGADLTINGSCILFTYDADNNGTLPSGISSASDDERYGFRLMSNRLQARPRGAPFNCSTSASNWEDITNPGVVQITGLTFSLNTVTLPYGATSGHTMQTRTVTITLSGRLTSDPTVTRTLSEQVRVRNDKFIS